MLLETTLITRNKIPIIIIIKLSDSKNIKYLRIRKVYI